MNNYATVESMNPFHDPDAALEEGRKPHTDPLRAECRCLLCGRAFDGVAMGINTCPTCGADVEPSAVIHDPNERSPRAGSDNSFEHGTDPFTHGHGVFYKKKADGSTERVR